MRCEIMTKQNSNKNELKWVEGRAFEILNLDAIHDNHLLDLSLFKNSKIKNESNLSTLEGKLEHEPEISSPDLYYIDDKNRTIVGYEHFAVTSTSETKHGAKSLATLGSIIGKKIPFSKRLINMPTGVSGDEAVVLVDNTSQKHKLENVSIIPGRIDHGLLYGNALNPHSEDVTVSRFSEISEDSLIKSTINNFKKHTNKVDKYIENLSTLRDNYIVKLNFVIDMSYITIPSVKMPEKDGHYHRLNNLVYGGLNRLIQETRYIFDELWELNNKGYDIGVIIIVPDAYSTYSINNYIPFFVNSYFAYYFYNNESIDKLLADNNNYGYVKDESFTFHQALYSLYNTVSKTEDTFRVNANKECRNIILIKKSKM